MTGWLLDTNVLSELRRRKPNRHVVAFIAGQPLDLLYVSSETLAEILAGCCVRIGVSIDAKCQAARFRGIPRTVG
jgi:predicted nucleic acid-binding protein